MNSIEIGVKREGPKSEEKHGLVLENAFPMNALRKRDPAKHSPLRSVIFGAILMFFGVVFSTAFWKVFG